MSRLHALWARLRPFARNPEKPVLSKVQPNPEKKASSARTLVALSEAGRAQWTPRNFTALAREGYMKNAVAYRCIRLLCEAAARVALNVEQDGKVAHDHPLKRLLDQPNPEMGGLAFKEHLFSSLQTSGNAYIEAYTDPDDTITELWPLRPDRVRILPSPRGWPEAYEYSVGALKTVMGRDLSGWLKVLHLKLFHPLDDWYGFSPLEAAAFSIDVHNASGQWNKALLDNAARPSGALIYGREGADRLTPEQFERLKLELNSVYAGAENAGRPLLLEGGLDWKSMALSPSEMDFIEGKNAAARDIALSFGVPCQLLGIPGDNSYANFKEAHLAFWRQAVLPLTERLVEGLNGWLSPKFGSARVRIDHESLTALAEERDSLWSRLDRAQFLTMTERRRMAGLAPIADCDDEEGQTS